MPEDMVAKVETSREDVVRNRNALEEIYREAGPDKWTLMQAVLAMTNSIVMLDAFLSEQEKKKKGD